MAVCLGSLTGQLGLALILCCCCCCFISTAEGRLPHPLLYFDPGDARVLQQQAHTTHAHLAKVIRNSVKSMMSKATFYLPPVEHEAFAARWNEIYGNNLGALAIYCVLFPGDETALKFTLEYMDRMCSYPRWQVRDAPQDEVPVAHSLVGFATAFDFLYPHMDPRRRAAHLAKIRAVTEEMYELSKFRAWGKHYLHNHEVTNVMAMLTGALVVEAHDRAAAAPWRQAATELMERTLFLLDHVVDGSLDEGVAYGSYTSRSVTQYIFLALRHFGINHTNSTWLREHFWFYYATSLPGYQRTVGIADSNYNWFYGPESQLVFLDRYVLRNGSGNWLAQQIRRSRPRDGPMEHSTSQRWCTLHTEYLWYDAQLVPRPPADHAAPRMHVFSNWGVVTYGGGLPRAPGNTFVSFKSGKLGGRAVFDIVHSGAYPWINGWKNFNPGHEHPDQNSFTFAPNGQAFVAEALYGPKHTYLNNALVFGPSPTSQCNQPWEGQLGECFQWLKWTGEGVGDTAGEVVTASQHGELMFTSGEAASAYSASMGLKSVYRSLLLLNSQTLLVVDHIERSEASPVSQASAFFHNMELDFKYVLQRVRDRYNGAVMDVWDAKYEMFWFDSQGNSPRAALQDMEQAAEFKKRWTQFVNVTFALRGPPTATRLAYVFHGPFVTLGDCRFVDEHRNGVRLHLEVNGTSQLVSIATRYQDPAARLAYLGFAGYAKLENERQITRFGLSQVVLREQGGESDLAYLMGVTVSFAVGITLGTALVLVAVRWKFYISFNRLVRLAMLGVVLLWVVELLVVWRACVHPLCGLGWERRRPPIATGNYGEGQQPLPEPDLHSVLPTVVVASLPASGAEILKELFAGTTDFAYIAAPTRLVRLPDTEFEVDPFVDACEWTYADMRSGRFPTLQGWFQSLLRNPRLHLQNMPLHGLLPKRRVLSHESGVSLGGTALPGDKPLPLNKTNGQGAPGGSIDLIEMLARDALPTESLRSRKLLHKKQPSKTLRRAKAKQEPEPLLQKRVLSDEESEAEYIRGLRAHLLAYPNTRIALHLTSGSWNLKLPFLRGLVGSSLRALYVVRDPRAWVHSMLYGSKPSHYAELDVAARLERLFQAAGAGRAPRRERCGLGSGYAFEFEPLRRLVSDADATPVALLAHVWLASTAAALRVNRQLPETNCAVVRFEELVQQPQAASERIYAFLGLPAPPAAINRILMATRSQVFRLPNEGLLSASAVSAWKAKMPRRDIREIEDICASMMTQLGYSKFME
ncbi:unnamed protein product [Lampetra fluviatilis]